MAENKTDRELQIDIAMLQADMDVALTTTLGLAAIIGAVILTLEQLYWETSEIYKTLFLSLSVVGLIVFFIILLQGGTRLNRIRKDIRKLKKQYVIGYKQ